MAALVSTSAMAAPPVKILDTAVVDGFTVNILRFPVVQRSLAPARIAVVLRGDAKRIITNCVMGLDNSANRVGGKRNRFPQ